MVSDRNFPMQKNVQSRKGRKSTPNGSNEEDNNAGSDGQSSSSCSSEDDSNASQELNGESKGSAALNSNGKTRASRGSATDPQSLYARVTINELSNLLKENFPNFPPNFLIIFLSNFSEKKGENKRATENLTESCPERNKGKQLNSIKYLNLHSHVLLQSQK